MKPLSDRIIVQLAPQNEKTTDSGLVLVTPGKDEKPTNGVVLATGPGRTENGVLIPIDVEVGDTVFFSKFSGINMEIDGEEVLVLTERDVLGKERK